QALFGLACNQSPCVIFNRWMNEGIEDVENEIDEEKYEGNEENGSLDEWVMWIGNGMIYIRWNGRGWKNGVC
ncbi:hypothetical protein, partial [Bacillus pumilus]|uniref:hypothetical protein n=1 Tax=Bacillus pumilus TaxID=1408 RepID=UPI001C92C31C